MPSAHNIRPLIGIDMQLRAPREPWAAPLIRAEMTYEDRSPGLYRIQVHGLPIQNGTWRYAASLRPGHRDTVFIDLDRRCSLVWRGR